MSTPGTTVWLAREVNDYEPCWGHYVFTTKEKAEAFIAKYHSSEWELDEIQLDPEHR